MSSSSWRNWKLAGGDFVADLLEAGDDLVPLVVGQDADLGEHVGVGDRAADVVGVEPAVEAHAFGELLDAMVHRLVEYTAPRLIGQGLPLKNCWRRLPAAHFYAALKSSAASISNIFSLNTLRQRCQSADGTRRPKNRQHFGG